jgi:hypothetical protein
MRHPLTTADRLALRHVVLEVPDWFGRPVDAVGQAATGGRLWLGAAAALGALGARGRRAAVNGVAAVLFIVFAHVAWPAVGLIAVGSVIGGQLGATVGRRIPPIVLRTLVVILGVGVAIRLILS